MALVGVVVLVPLGLFITLLAVSDPEQSFLSGRGIVGEQAPPIEGPLLRGGNFDLNQHKDKWVVVNFFASWCPGCIEEYPELLELYESPDSKNNLTVVTIVYNDTLKKVEESIIRYAPWPVIAGQNLSDTGQITVEYSVTALPETYIISPEGLVVEKLVGASGVTADAIAQIIERESQRILAAQAEPESG